MPTLPSPPCRQPGCPSLAQAGGYCSLHKKQAIKEINQRIGSPCKRGYDRTWQKARLMYLAENPLCADCGRPAEEVHHISKIKDSPFERLNPDNMMALCVSCHAKRTNQEIEASRA